MARERKDRSGNWFLQNYGGSLLRLVKIQNMVAWRAAPTVLSYPKQIPDGLLDVSFAGADAPVPFLIEIEAYPGTDVAEQIRQDLAMVLLTRRVVPDILVIVLFPKGRLKVEPEQIAFSARALTEFRLKVRVVNLWEVPAEELLASDDVGLFPWVPCAHYEGPPEKLLEQCRDRIEEEAKPEEKENLLAVARTMAETRYNNPQLLSLLGGTHMSLAKALLDLPPGQRLIAALNRKTACDTAREFVVLLLEERFGEVPDDVVTVLDSVNSRRKLVRLHKLAATCRDLKTFRAALGK